MAVWPAAVEGFALGASLIIAIGAQNAFVLRQGLARLHVLPVVLVCAVSDALLIAAGVAGLGTMLSGLPQVISVIAFAGAAFLFWYGWKALRRSFSVETLRVGGGADDDRGRVLAACLAFTWLNPHVFLDTVVLVGSLSARFAGGARLAFGAGAATASLVWFGALGYGARLLTPLFAKPIAWRVLDLMICAVMWLIAGGLLTSALNR